MADKKKTQDREYAYAHNDTAAPEKPSATAVYNDVDMPDGLREIQRLAREREIPVCDDETLNFLTGQIAACRAKNILEIGTATGITDVLILTMFDDTRMTTIESNEDFFVEAKKNCSAFGVSDRAELILGDAGAVLKTLEGEYDFIFLDGPKVQYIKYLPDLKRLLSPGGVLFADDVLLYGYVTGEVETPRKRLSIVGHIKEYIDAVTMDVDFMTTIVNIGDGVALSVKKR